MLRGLGLPRVPVLWTVFKVLVNERRRYICDRDLTQLERNSGLWIQSLIPVLSLRKGQKNKYISNFFLQWYRVMCINDRWWGILSKLPLRI